MDLTALASSLLQPVPAHRTLGIEVSWSGDGVGEVTMPTPPEMTNVIGSLHSSGLVALVDAAGLAAIIGACSTEADFERILPLGTHASLEFHAPARGHLVASCTLDETATQALHPLLTRTTDRAQLSTHVDVVDARGNLVSRGTFEWSVRRLPRPPDRAGRPSLPRRCHMARGDIGCSVCRPCPAWLGLGTRPFPVRLLQKSRIHSEGRCCRPQTFKRESAKRTGGRGFVEPPGYPAASRSRTRPPRTTRPSSPLRPEGRDLNPKRAVALGRSWQTSLPNPLATSLADRQAGARRLGG
jgi:uncharacterized protein (TIGR00369 family)